MSSTESDEMTRAKPCKNCGEPSVVYGALVVNTRVYREVPLCDDCFVPVSDLQAPCGRPLEEPASKEGRLITTPLEDVFHCGTAVIIRHGPGSRSILPAEGLTR